MEILLFFVLIYAGKRAWDDTWKAWGKSRSAYMDRADKRFPGMPAPRRAGHALRHDLGYGLSQAGHGFPQTRHGLAAGWHEGRQAHAQARAERERAKADHLETRARLIPDLREYRSRQKAALEQIRAGEPQATPDDPATEAGEAGEGSEGSQGTFEPVLLTGRSKSGRPLNPFTGEPVDSATVWDQEDLDRRLAAAAEDPDIEVSTRPLSATNCDLCGEPLPPGYAGIAHPGCIDDHEQDTASPAKGNDMAAADTTYDGVLERMASAIAAAEDRAAEAGAAKNWANQTADEMQSLDLDPATLGAMADHLDALDAAEKAQQRVIETAEAVKSALQRGHGGLNEAHQSAPVEAADKEFYAG